MTSRIKPPLNQTRLPTLLLASASPRRAELLREMDVAFTVVKADVLNFSPDIFPSI